MRRGCDYFFNNIAGGVPPANYEPKSYEELVRAYYADGPDPSQGIGEADGVE